MSKENILSDAGKEHVGRVCRKEYRLVYSMKLYRTRDRMGGGGVGRRKGQIKCWALFCDDK